jgi:thiol-disulfide isomerase/thioredoxin
MSRHARFGACMIRVVRSADARHEDRSLARITRPMIRRGAAWAMVLLLLAACGSQPQVRSGTNTPGSVAPSPTPSLVGMGLNGEHLDIASYRGHPVVIYFWGSWCDPCRAEQPDLNALAARYPSVRFIGDDVRDVLANARTYALDLNVRYPSVVDPLSADSQPFQVPAVPTTIVLNGKGAIVGRYLGTVSGISKQLDVLLSTSG